MLDPKPGMGTHGSGAAEGPDSLPQDWLVGLLCPLALGAQSANLETPELSKPAASTGWAEVQDRARPAACSTGGTVSQTGKRC